MIYADQDKWLDAERANNQHDRSRMMQLIDQMTPEGRAALATYQHASYNVRLYASGKWD